MGFEMPDLNNQSEENEEPIIEIPKKEEPDKLKNVKKIAGIVALGATVLATEGCSPDKNEILKEDKPVAQHESINKTSSGGRLSAEYHRNIERNKKVSGMILDNVKATIEGKIDFANNPFLKMYYQCIGDGGHIDSGYEQIFEEGVNMRILEIAKKKGIELDLSKGFKCHNVTKGHVPVSAEINGVSILINSLDYTPEEMRMINFENGESVQNDNVPTRGKVFEQSTVSKGSNNVRTGPDFDKDANF